MFKLVIAFLALVGIGQSQDTTYASAKSYPKSVQLSYTVLGSSDSSSQHLATVDYDPKSLDYILSSWTPPSVDALQSTSQEPTSTPLLRILLPNGSATVTSLGTFDTKLSQDIDIWVSMENGGEVVSASIRSITPPPLSKEEELQRQKEERLRKRGKAVPEKPKAKPKSKTKKPKDAVVEPAQTGPVVRVNLLAVGPGPAPKLNSRKPPQLDAEGREVIQEEQQEKTFLQKYWYILLAVAFVLMSGGGGKE